MVNTELFLYGRETDLVKRSGLILYAERRPVYVVLISQGICACERNTLQ